MKHREILEKLEQLRVLYKAAQEANNTSDEAATLYGELEEVFNRYGGIREVRVPSLWGVEASFPNYVAARLLSTRTIYSHEGYMQILQVIGKVKAHAGGLIPPQEEISLEHLSRVLGRFRECCQYVVAPPAREKDVQDLVWVVLRSHFDRLVREEVLPVFGAKSYKPDFGIPSLRCLVEVKFIGSKTDITRVQEEVLADVPGYLNAVTGYDSVAILVYDAAQKLRDSSKFTADLTSVEGVVTVVVVPGIG